MPNYGSAPLATIEDGKVPETRMKDARQVQDFCRRIIDNDEKRSFKRSRVNGLVDGNPPYRASKLKDAGRADACNVNWGMARSCLEAAVGAFYDLFSESPLFLNVLTSFGDDPEKKAEWSRTISEEADRTIRTATEWDYNMQLSQWDMVLHGPGPLFFEDAYRVLPKAVLAGDLKLPEFSKSDTKYWDVCALQVTYYPPELYEFIRNEEAAAKVGWDVEYTKLVIQNAMDIRIQPGLRYEWEYYQQELKNNSLSYFDDTRVCRVCHVFWREFSGKVTHAIVERDTTVNRQDSGDPKFKQDYEDIKFLFNSHERYQSFQQCVHPMYFDHGNGGWHHSVTGLGVKMFSAMEYQNRLICNLADKAFAPKILFKPTSTESSQKFSMAHFGDYAVLPGGFDWQQTGVAGLMNDGLAMNNTLSEMMQSNLASYREQPQQKQGNPVTAREIMYQAQQQSSLSKTQFNRYYEQLDMLYGEIYRRMSNLNSTDERAQEFQKRCEDRGVPKEALGRISKVEATRVTGQGSAFVRKQSLSNLWQLLAPALPENGRDNLICDMIGAEAGQSSVEKYYPTKSAEKLATDQQAEALQWVGLMKIGVQPVVTASQNAVTYAGTFLSAATQALQSLQQGADPHGVLTFLHVAGPAIAAHLKRFAKDPTRAVIFKEIEKQWKKMAELTDKLQKQIEQQGQSGKQQQDKTQQAMTDEQIKQAKAKNDIAIKTAKTKAQLKQSQEKHQQKMVQGQQSMALKDATVATDIHRKNRLAAFQSKEKKENGS
jgi:hypothetical protein